MREAIGRIIGAGVGFMISLIPAWFGMTEALTAELQMSITALLITLGYAITHKLLRSNVPTFSDD